MSSINWGIVAPGNIAQAFARALHSVESANCYAVYSRSAQRAQQFADQFGFIHASNDLQSMLADEALDVVYIASPHQAHAAQASTCLQAGKAVLCEKPISVNGKEAAAVFKLAAERGVFCMEAVWTRFLPVYKGIRDWLDDGSIGEVRLLQSTFGLKRTYDPHHRLFNPLLAGGSILDLGIYPVSLADWLFDEQPQSITAVGNLGASGVDEQMSGILKYTGGRIAQIGSALNVQTSHTATIYGTEGHILIDAPAHGTEGATLVFNNPKQEDRRISLPHALNGYEYEIAEVHRCLGRGLIESPTLPWSTSLRVMRTLDELRKQVGLRYAFE